MTLSVNGNGVTRQGFREKILRFSPKDCKMDLVLPGNWLLCFLWALECGKDWENEMNYYLIDYENTGENGLDGLTELGSNDQVVIFYSENADKMSFDLHRKLQECRAVIEFRKIATGKKNALDFQLAAYLGYLMAKEEDSRFCIVSKDLGYEVLLDFWKEKNIKLIGAISAETKKTAEEKSELEASLLRLVGRTDFQMVMDCIKNGKSKQTINNLLVKQYGSEKAGELYKKIKPFLKEKKGK